MDDEMLLSDSELDEVATVGADWIEGVIDALSSNAQTRIGSNTRLAIAELRERRARTKPSAPDREAVARIIRPVPFEAWQAMYDYNIKNGETDADAQRWADQTHGADIAEALAKADAILALFPQPAPSRPACDCCPTAPITQADAGAFLSWLRVRYPKGGGVNLGAHEAIDRVAFLCVDETFAQPPPSCGSDEVREIIAELREPIIRRVFHGDHEWDSNEGVPDLNKRAASVITTLAQRVEEAQAENGRWRNRYHAVTEDGMRSEDRATTAEAALAELKAQGAGVADASILGAGRMFDNARAILVSFNRPLTDDELGRFLHWIQITLDKVADNLTAAVEIETKLTAPPLPQSEGNGWRGISTAPKDGTAFLAVKDDHYEVVFYHSIKPEIDPTTSWVWATQDGPTFHVAAFNFWRPLPPPPQVDGGQS